MINSTSNIPKLRFPGFEGEWGEKKLGYLGKFKSGQGFNEKEQGGKKGIPFYKVSDMNNVGNEKIMYYANNYVNDEQIIRQNYRIIKKKSIIFAKVGAAIFLERKRVAQNFIFDNNMMAFTPDRNIEFIRYIFENTRLSKFAQTGALPSYNASDLSILKVKMPNSETEQKKIASFFSKVDDWIENLKEQKDNLEQYKKGMMQKIFSQKVRFKDENGKEFEEWKCLKISDFGTIVGGGTPDTKKSDYWNGDINWFTPTEIKQKNVEDSLRKISNTGLKMSSAKLLPIGSLLLTSRATIGDVSINKKESATNQGFQSIVVNKNNSNIFLYFWILKNKKEFLRKANGSTFLEISGKDVAKIKNLFPSLPEQQKIASFLTSIDKIIDLKQQQIVKTEEWKKGLMQMMFV